MHRAKFWLPDHIYVSSSSSSSSWSSSSSDDDDEYNPMTNGDNTNQLAPDPLLCRPPRSSAHKVLPVVGAFAVQCHYCSKWRLIPTEKKYEEIREHNLQHPFVCEKAREWQRDISCVDPEDVSQDDSMIWAIDKPEIPQTPDGWQRLLQIRGEGSSQFADIYYEAPSGKKLRSMPEVKKFLADHPEYRTDGVTLARFSYQMPKPLQENYVKKKRSRAKSVEPKQGIPVSRPAKKQATQSFLRKDAI